MLGALLLDEGSMFVAFFALLRMMLLICSFATLFYTVRRKPSRGRAPAMLIAVLALAFACLLPQYDDGPPYTVIALAVPVLVGLYMDFAYPHPPSSDN
jgi:peptidoglycan/LPS O-acetylase OafA/YrhL